MRSPRDRSHRSPRKMRTREETSRQLDKQVDCALSASPAPGRSDHAIWPTVPHECTRMCWVRRGVRSSEAPQKGSKKRARSSEGRPEAPESAIQSSDLDRRHLTPRSLICSLEWCRHHQCSSNSELWEANSAQISRDPLSNLGANFPGPGTSQELARLYPSACMGMLRDKLLVTSGEGIEKWGREKNECGGDDNSSLISVMPCSGLEKKSVTPAPFAAPEPGLAVRTQPAKGRSRDSEFGGAKGVGGQSADATLRAFW